MYIGQVLCHWIHSQYPVTWFLNIHTTGSQIEKSKHKCVRNFKINRCAKTLQILQTENSLAYAHLQWSVRCKIQIFVLRIWIYVFWVRIYVLLISIQRMCSSYRYLCSGSEYIYFGTWIYVFWIWISCLCWRYGYIPLSYGWADRPPPPPIWEMDVF